MAPTFYFMFELLSAILSQLSYPTWAMIMAAINTTICFAYWSHQTHITTPKTPIKHRELCASASEFIFSLIAFIYHLKNIPNPLNICPTPLIFSFSAMYRHHQKLALLQHRRRGGHRHDDESLLISNNLSSLDTTQQQGQSDNLAKLAIKRYLEEHLDEICGDIQQIIFFFEG